jgi:hypothetical protein
MAPFAAGVNGVAVRGWRAGPAAVCGLPILLPVVPRLSAFEVFGPGDPPATDRVSVRQRGSGRAADTGRWAAG